MQKTQKQKSPEKVPKNKLPKIPELEYFKALHKQRIKKSKSK